MYSTYSEKSNVYVWRINEKEKQIKHDNLSTEKKTFITINDNGKLFNI